MEFDPVLLERLELVLATTFHVVFPAFTVALSVYVAALTSVWAVTGTAHYRALARLWTAVLAIAFAMGAVSGLLMAYQYGANWPRFVAFGGDVIGPLIMGAVGASLVSAVCLFALMIGAARIGRGLEVAAAIIMSLSSIAATVLLVAANSWMHTPTGHTLVNGAALPVDWWAVVLNPSFPYRLAHVLNASALTAGFVVLAVGARYWLAERHPDQARAMIKAAVLTLAVLAPAQLVIGSLHGLNTLKFQPIKTAAIEAHWDSEKPVDFQIVAWPDETSETNRWSLSIPNAGSLVLTHRLSGLIIGLKDVAPQNRPPVATVFVAFRIMLAIGLFMIAAALIGSWLLWRGILFETRWYLRLVTHTWWIGFVAVIAGWVVTEIGRQPWMVQGILRTAETAVPMTVTGAATLAIAYAAAMALGMHGIGHLIERGPQPPVGGRALPPIQSAGDAQHEVMMRRS